MTKGTRRLAPPAYPHFMALPPPRWTVWTSAMRGSMRMACLGGFPSAAGVLESVFLQHPVTSLPDKTYLHVFKGAIQPLWEDAHNAAGGHLKLVCESRAESEAVWRALVVRFLQEDFEDCWAVTGISIIAHRTNLIKVWTAHDDVTHLWRLRSFLQSLLHPSSHETHLSFVQHRAAAWGSTRRPRGARPPSSTSPAASFSLSPSSELLFGSESMISAESRSSDGDSGNESHLPVDVTASGAQNDVLESWATDITGSPLRSSRRSSTSSMSSVGRCSSSPQASNRLVYVHNPYSLTQPLHYIDQPPTAASEAATVL